MLMAALFMPMLVVTVVVRRVVAARSAIFVPMLVLAMAMLRLAAIVPMLMMAVIMTAARFLGKSLLERCKHLLLRHFRALLVDFEHQFWLAQQRNHAFHWRAPRLLALELRNHHRHVLIVQIRVHPAGDALDPLFLCRLLGFLSRVLLLDADHDD